MPEGPLRILELRTVRGTGGGPEKTILLGTARTDPSRYSITVGYIRDDRDRVFHIDRRAKGLPVDYVELRERHSFDPRVWTRLTALVRSRGIDLVHSHDYKTDLLAWLLARRLGVIPLATAHGWTGHSARERYFYYPGDRMVLSRFPHVIAVSSEIRATLVRAGADPRKVTVILNAIDPTMFRRRPDDEAAARARVGCTPGDFVIGAVGRLEPQKDFGRLIDAFATLVREFPRARLVIGGEGSLRPALEAQIDRLGLHAVCRLLGHVDDIASLHHALDLFVQSSIYEGTPNAVLEAMALETPVVATAAGGTAEIACDGREALIVPCGSTDALARALAAAIDGPEATAHRVRAARHRVETALSFDLRLRCVEAIYDDLARRFLGRARGRELLTRCIS